MHGPVDPWRLRRAPSRPGSASCWSGAATRDAATSTSGARSDRSRIPRFSWPSTPESPHRTPPGTQNTATGESRSTGEVDDGELVLGLAVDLEREWVYLITAYVREP